MNPQYKQPPQLRPHQRAWEKWQEALYSTLKFSRSLDLPDHWRFGSWIYSASTARWIYSKYQDRSLHLYPKGWTAYRPLIIRQGRSSYWRFILIEDKPIQNPPEDSLSKNIEAISSSKVKSTGTQIKGIIQSPTSIIPLWKPPLTFIRQS